MSLTLPFYRERGESSTTIFLFHGAYGDGRYFDKLAEHFADLGYRTVTWDCPGYGESPVLETSTIETYADAATNLVDELGTERNVLLGHSMGALVAPRVAAQAKANIVGVILSAATAGFKTRTPEEQAKFLEERLDPIRNGMAVSEYAPGLLKVMMGPGASGPEVDKVVRVVSEMETETFERSLTAITLYDGREALRNLKVPTLLVAGEYDTACPPAGMRVIHDLVADSTYVEIPGIGHYGFAEDFENYTKPIEQFLSQVAGLAG